MFICIFLNVFVCFISVFNVYVLKCMGINSFLIDFFLKLKILEFYYYLEIKIYKIVDLVVLFIRDINYFFCFLNYFYFRFDFRVVGI